MIKLPLVSIIINCYNGEKFLKDCLDSITSQSYKNWEIIFWDNCSTDNSKDILDKYKSYSIKYFCSDNFLKLYDARNLAIQKASGKYICFLDADDFWEKDKIELQVKFLEKNNEFKMVYSNYYIYDNLKKEKLIKHNFELPSGKITSDILKKYSIGILTTCLNREVFEKHFFNKKYEIIGDFDFFVKLSEKISVGCIQKPLASYRLHSENYSKKKINLYINELKDWINENSENLSKNNLSVFHQKIYLLKLILKKYLIFLGRVVQW